MTNYNQPFSKDNAPKPGPPPRRSPRPVPQATDKPGPVPAEPQRAVKPELPASVRHEALREEVKRAKRSKAEKESEFIANVEMLLGGALVDWQRDILLEIRRASLEGRELKVTPDWIQARRKF